MIELRVAVVQQAVDVEPFGCFIDVAGLEMALEQELRSDRVSRIELDDLLEQLYGLPHLADVHLAAGKGNPPAGIPRALGEGLLEDLDRFGDPAKPTVFVGQLQVDLRCRVGFPEKLQLFEAATGVHWGNHIKTRKKDEAPPSWGALKTTGSSLLSEEDGLNTFSRNAAGSQCDTSCNEEFRSRLHSDIGEGERRCSDTIRPRYLRRRIQNAANACGPPTFQFSSGDELHQHASRW